MSVIVSGMEMPEHCGYCRFRYDGICHALQKTQYSMEECPLVPVPEHGRLIESKAFLKVAYETDDFSLDELAHLAVLVAATPTVIPAEEGE